MRKLYRNKSDKLFSPLLLGLLVLLPLLGILGSNIMYRYSRDFLLKERDDQLFSLAYTLDNTLVHEIKEVQSAVGTIVFQPSQQAGEELFLSTLDPEALEERFRDSYVTEKSDYVDVFAEYKGLTVPIYGSIVHTELTWPKGQKNDNFTICYDEDENYFIDVMIASRYTDITYHVLLDLEHFYGKIVPVALRRTHWVVFLDAESGLSLQNHDNQPAYRVMSQDAYMERNDGYSYILGNELNDQRGAITYQYNNYEGRLVDERIITLPSCETTNGTFAIGISLDSENLYNSLRNSNRKMILLVLVLIILEALILARILHNYYGALQSEREQEHLKKEEELNRQLSEAQLQNSTSQMQPHFLYNVLSSIRELILEEPEYAADMLYDFTLYLRACLKSLSGRVLISFGEEVRNIMSYVNIEKMRMGDRLQVVFDIEDDSYNIPALTIQPLVENAIRHGIAKKRDKSGRVEISSKLVDGTHTIVVKDDGLGFDYEKICAEIESGERDSTGIQNMILRLEKCVQASVEIDSVPGQGTTVTVRIPVEQGEG